MFLYKILEKKIGKSEKNKKIPGSSDMGIFFYFTL